MKHRTDDRAMKYRVEDPAETRVQKHRTFTLPASALRVFPSMGLAAPPVTSTPVPLEKPSHETAITVGVGLVALVAGIGLAYAVTRPANLLRTNPIRSDDLRAWVDVFQDMVTRRIEERSPFPSLHPPRTGAVTKYWIGPLKEEALRQGMTSASFDEHLWEAHRAGLLRMGRADLTSVFSPTLVAQSEIVHFVNGRPSATFHFVEFR